jgi:Tol biopolymer transport system component
MQAADGGAPVGLLERSTEAIAQMPAFTPDGTRVIFAALLFLPDGNLRGDIRAVNVATGAVQPVVQAPKEEIVYFYPRPAQDGRLLVTRIDALQTLSETARLEWVDVQGGGERTTIVRDARDGDVSRDGSQIAFVRYEVASMRSSLWVADAEGKNERRLVAPGTFVTIQAPRFSPDGEWLAFSVHGAPQEDLPHVSRDCAVPLWLFCFAQTASAHSAPGAVWRVNLTNGKFQQLTDIYDDSPVSAWGSSDTQLAIHDFTGIRLIDLARQEIYPLYLEDGGLGGFDWYAP